MSDGDTDGEVGESTEVAVKGRGESEIERSE